MTALIWVVGILCAASALAGSVFLHDDVPRRWLAGTGVLGVLTIALAPRDSSSVAAWLLTAGGVLALVLLVAAPRRRDRIFRLGANLGRETFPNELLESTGPRPASILDPLFERRKIIDSPPSGYWSVIFPNPMTVGRQYVVDVRCMDGTAAGHFRGLQELGVEAPADEDVTLSITLIAPSFTVAPAVRPIGVRTGRRLATDFFVVPTQRGRFPLRLELSLGEELLGWFEEKIAVRPNTQTVVAVFAMLTGLAGGVLAIVSGLGLAG